jgi:hypothetical protein
MYANEHLQSLYLYVKQSLTFQKVTMVYRTSFDELRPKLYNIFIFFDSLSSTALFSFNITFAFNRNV